MGWQDTYKSGGLMPTMQHGSAPTWELPNIGGDLTLDWDSVLTIDLIREHTKTDDVPSVSDNQLRLYRKAAIEAAEQYTSLLLGTSRVVTEAVDRPWSRREIERGSYVYSTQYPITDGIVYIFGEKSGGSRKLATTPGSRKVRIPLVQVALDLGCEACRPVCGGEANHGMQIMYRAGFSECSGVPAGVILGMLKYIAWNITHPGDEISSVRNREKIEGGQLSGTNNIAWASGALEL